MTRSDKFFTDDMTVFDIDLKPHRYDIYNSENGLIVRAYINDNPVKDGDNEYSNRKFLCISDNDGEFEISSVTILENGNGYSNYFYLDNAQFSHMMATEYAVVDSDDKTIIQNGWRRLKYSDEEYRKISTLTNYFNGNNPHNGNLTYDNGYEYFKYFKTLFKYACEEELFDDRCHDNVYDLVQMLQEDKYGFSSLTEENYKNLDADTKIPPFFTTGIGTSIPCAAPSRNPVPKKAAHFACFSADCAVFFFPRKIPALLRNFFLFSP